MIEVRDGQRILKFEGEQIGTSSSKRRDSVRWIEFTLYKTEGSQYVLSRIGFSKIYHLPECEIAERGHLDESNRLELVDEDRPCEVCLPHLSDFPFVSFERKKEWARVYSAPEGVIEGLMKTDPKSNNRFMTAVARRLLEDAGQVDDALYEAVNVEVIQ
jgi:hypothetical protein